MPTTTFDFTGHTVVVSGAARGIGAGMATTFAAAGADVFAVDSDAAALDELTRENNLHTRAIDVTDGDAVRGLVDAIVEQTGRIDTVVNNAGILRDSMVWKMDDDAWSSVLAVHLGGTFGFTRAAIPHMRSQGRGRIINVTSYTGLRGNPGQANYGTAKAGLIGFTKTVAKEVGRFGITVNAISPSAETRMVASIPEDVRAQMTAAIPLRRIAQPIEIAPTVCFLASDEASYITGAVVPVDGGVAI